MTGVVIAELGTIWVGVGAGLAGAVIAFAVVAARLRRAGEDRRRLQEELRAREDALKQSVQERSRLLSGITHEMRNPLNGVLGVIPMLRGAGLGPREKYLLGTLHRCAEHLRTTVDGLGTVCDEAGKLELASDTFDLAELVDTTLSATDLAGDKVRLGQWTGARPWVVADSAKLGFILGHFIGNALRHGVPPRATVEVFVGDQADGRCGVTMAVRNYGPDIPADELARVFDRFASADFKTVRQVGGTGLGLYVCKAYAVAMGGAVTATSFGGTTTFQVSVTLDKTVAPMMREAASTGSRGRVLVVEDEDYNRLVLGNLLTTLGYTVDWAEDGKSALRLAPQHVYSLVLTDWMLPDMDGGELTRKLLPLCQQPVPPVIAVTAYAGTQKEAECRAAGMAGMISKPLSREKLEAALVGLGNAPATRSSPSRSPHSKEISVEALRQLGPLERMVPEFSRRLRDDWSKAENLRGRDRVEAANLVHKLISLCLVIQANAACEQLRLLEAELRGPAEDESLKRRWDSTETEIARALGHLSAAAPAAASLNGVRTPS